MTLSTQCEKCQLSVLHLTLPSGAPIVVSYMPTEPPGRGNVVLANGGAQLAMMGNGTHMVHVCPKKKVKKTK